MSEPRECAHVVENGYCPTCGVLLYNGVVQTYSAEEIASAKEYATQTRSALFGEPREWWICLAWHQNGGSSVEKVYWASTSESALTKTVGGLKIGKSIAVVEREAYDALREAYSKLRDTPGGKKIWAAINEIERLQAENKRLKEYMPKEKNDAQIKRDAEHAKRELVRIQNTLDKARLELSNANERASNSRQELERLQAENDRLTTMLKGAAEESEARMREIEGLKARVKELGGASC